MIKKIHLNAAAVLADAAANHAGAHLSQDKLQGAVPPFLAVHDDTSQELAADADGWIEVLAGKVSLTVYDSKGRVVLIRRRSVEGHWKKGP
jgi:hypothetical protein